MTVLRRAPGYTRIDVRGISSGQRRIVIDGRQKREELLIF